MTQDHFGDVYRFAMFSRLYQTVAWIIMHCIIGFFIGPISMFLTILRGLISHTLRGSNSMVHFKNNGTGKTLY